MYCVIKVLAAEPRSKKKEWGRGVCISRGFAANSHSTGTAAPPPNLPRLVHNTASYAGHPTGGDVYVSGTQDAGCRGNKITVFQKKRVNRRKPKETGAKNARCRRQDVWTPSPLSFCQK